MDGSGGFPAGSVPLTWWVAHERTQHRSVPRRIRWVAERPGHAIGEAMTVVIVILAVAGAATFALGVWLTFSGGEDDD